MILKKNAHVYLISSCVVVALLVTLFVAKALKKAEPYFSFAVMASVFSVWILTSGQGPDSLRFWFSSKSLGCIDVATLAFIPCVLVRFYRQSLLANASVSETRKKVLLASEVLLFLSGVLYLFLFTQQVQLNKLTRWFNVGPVLLLVACTFGDSVRQIFELLQGKNAENRPFLILWCLTFCSIGMISFHDFLINLRALPWQYLNSWWSLVLVTTASFLAVSRAFSLQMIQFNKDKVRLQTADYIEQMVSRVIHDVIGPIMMLKRQCLMISEATGSSFMKLKHMVLECADTTTKMAKKLKAKHESETRLEVNVKKLLNEAFLMASLECDWLETKKKEFQVNAPEGLFLYCIPLEVKMMLKNLIKNAFEAQRASNTVRLQVKVKPKEHRISIKVKNPGELSNDALLCTNEMRPLASSKQEGREGVGMAIVFDAIKKHHGEIKAKNKLFLGKSWVKMEVIL